MTNKTTENSDLTNAFETCLQKIEEGFSIQACLELYPQRADELKSLLTTSQFVKDNASNSTEIALAQDRVRGRVLRAIYSEPVKKQPNFRTYSIGIASIVTILFISLLLYMTEHSLPGDSLYPAKLKLEHVLSRTEYNQRRIAEVKQILKQGAVAEVNFEGEVKNIEFIDAYEQWQIADLTVVVSSDTEIDGDRAIGSQVELTGYTTPQHELMAISIHIIDANHSQTLTPTMPITINQTTALPTLTSTATIASATLTPPSTVKSTIIPDEVVQTDPICYVDTPDSPLVYVRTGGSNQHPIINRLISGNTYSVIGFNTNYGFWYAVQLTEDNIGWFDSLTIEPQGDCDELPELEFSPATSEYSSNSGNTTGSTNQPGSNNSNTNGNPTSIPSTGDDDGDDGDDSDDSDDSDDDDDD